MTPPASAVTIWGHEKLKNNTPERPAGRVFILRKNVTAAKRKQNFRMAPATIPTIFRFNAKKVRTNRKFPIPIKGMNGMGIGEPVSSAVNGATKAIIVAPQKPA